MSAVLALPRSEGGHWWSALLTGAEAISEARREKQSCRQRPDVNGK
jgi:hypothetical protein